MGDKECDPSSLDPTRDWDECTCYTNLSQDDERASWDLISSQTDLVVGLIISTARNPTARNSNEHLTPMSDNEWEIVP